MRIQKENGGYSLPFSFLCIHVLSDKTRDVLKHSLRSEFGSRTRRRCIREVPLRDARISDCVERVSDIECSTNIIIRVFPDVISDIRLDGRSFITILWDIPCISWTIFCTIEQFYTCSCVRLFQIFLTVFFPCIFCSTRICDMCDTEFLCDILGSNLDSDDSLKCTLRVSCCIRIHEKCRHEKKVTICIPDERSWIIEDFRI